MKKFHFQLIMTAIILQFHIFGLKMKCSFDGSKAYVAISNFQVQLPYESPTPYLIPGNNYFNMLIAVFSVVFKAL